jgi:DNA-binding transcriptional ArsR family regulator
MVKYSAPALDAVFRALADTTRRSILTRLLDGEMRVTDLAEPYAMSLPAVSRHLGVLERARLIRRRRAGRTRLCRIDDVGLKTAASWIAAYRSLWEDSFDALDDLLRGETDVNPERPES